MEGPSWGGGVHRRGIVYPAPASPEGPGVPSERPGVEGG